MTKFSVRDIDLVNELDRSKKDFAAIKSAQYYGGTQLRMRETVTDIQASENDVMAGEVIYKRIVFTAKNQKNPIGKLLIDPRVGSPTTPDTAGDVSVLYYVPIPTLPDTSQLVWEVDIRAGSTPFWVEFTVLSSDDGTIEVKPVPF